MDIQQNKPIRRINATLPEPLAHFVAEMTGEHGLYETPSEFIRDLIRRYMEQQQRDSSRVNALLAQSLAENKFTPMPSLSLHDVRRALDE